MGKNSKLEKKKYLKKLDMYFFFHLSETEFQASVCLIFNKGGKKVKRQK